MSSDDDFQPGKADLESDFDDGPGSPSSSSSFEVISVKRKPASGKATKRPAARAPSKSVKKPRKSATEAIGDIEDGGYINRDHGYSWHDTEDVEGSAASLLDWFESVRERRGMPWRKKYDPSLTDEEKAQRAYEIWVSEVMLQQTQVTTVIAYWNRWVEKWPTIADLAKADIEEVNAVWRGLGYYRRASSLLNGAKKIVRDSKQDGRLSEDPVYLEKNVDGIGRYTAGAITSMAYGVRTPTVDGNIHRVLSRLLAYHATFGDKRSTDFLWSRATRIVNSLPRGADNEGIAGDWNQALMELGNQICKPVSPNCTECPVQKACHAYAELSAKPKSVKFDDVCDHCEPMPGKGNLIPSVTVFPMKKAKKASRDEDELVCIVETEGDERKWLFTKRPEKGLLAGLFQPPTLAIEAESTPAERLDLATGLIAETLNVEQSTISKSITSHKFHEPVKHIFSHINMTYHVLHLVLAKGDTIKASGQSVWWTAEEVESGNVGTGVKKCWAEVYGEWGSFEAGGATKPAAAKKTVKKRTRKVDLKAKSEPGEKLVKKVMMPMMPSR